jgi:hypothetical protein
MKFMLVQTNTNRRENAAFLHVFGQFGMLVQLCFVQDFEVGQAVWLMGRIAGTRTMCLQAVFGSFGRVGDEPPPDI